MARPRSALCLLLLLTSCADETAPGEDCGASRLRVPATGSCVSEATVDVAMDDDVALDTRVLLPPTGEGPWPALLVRTPYAVPNGNASETTFLPFVDDGYALIVQSVRGTGASGGTLDPLVQEFADGRDTVRWIADQPWSTGRVGAIGASYEGFTAVAAGIGNPEVAVVVSDGNISDAFSGWPGQRGITLDSGLLWWLELVATGRDLLADGDYHAAITNDRPLVDLDLEFLGEEHPVWRSAAAEAERDSEFWAARSTTGKMSSLCAPALYFQAASEWSDDPARAFREAVLDPCSAEVAGQQRFVLGQHGHTGAVYDPFAASFSGELLRAYLATFLKDEEGGLADDAPVAYHVAGADEWRTADEWPPASSEPVTFYLAAGSETLSDVPGADGEAVLAFDAVAMDACDAASAPGSAWFLSDPLPASLDVVGVPEVQLTVSADVADGDLVATLYELGPDDLPLWSTTQRLRLRFRDGYESPQAMPQGTPTEVLIAWGSVARRVSAGSRLGLWITTSACGMPESTGTMGSMMTGTATASGAITVHTGGDAPSRVVLPALPAPPE